MKHFKQFFTMLMLIAFNVGNVWGAEETATIQTTCWGNTAQSYQTDVREFTDEQGNKWHATGYGVTENTAVVIGKGGANYLETPNFSGNISSISVTWSGNASYYLALQTTSGTELDAKSNVAAGTTATFSVSGSYTQLRLVGRRSSGNSNAAATISKVVVTYSTGSTTPSLTATPTMIDFGTVEQGASVAAKTVTVTYANLSGSVTYSGLSDAFAASGTGTIAASGDEITISANTSAIGEYEQTLTIQSTVDSKSQNVTVTMNVVAPFEGLKLTFPDYNDKSVSSYTTSWTATKSGQVWSIANFNNYSNGWAYIKAGRNGNASVATITTQVEDHAVSAVTVTVDAVTAAKINSHKLYVADNSSFTGAIEIEGDPATIAAGDIVYTIPVANRDNDLYYKLEYDCASGSSNGFLQISKITYAYAAATPQKQNAGLAYDAADAQKLAKVGGTLTAPTLTNPNSLTIAYASSNTDVVEVNASTGAITAIKAAGKAVITASSEEDATYKAGSATYTIFVATEAGTAEDPLTEASAKALIDNGCTLNVNVKGTVVTVGSLNTTYGSISLTLTDGFQFYGMLNTSGAQFTENPFGVGDVVTAVGNLKKHNTTYELDLNCQLVERIPFAGSKTSIANTKETAYTVAQALAYAADPTTYDLTDHVYIAGVVYQVNSFNSTNGTYNIYIKDAGTSEDDGKFEFYKCSGLYEVGGTSAQFAEGDVQIGDEVIGYGVMTYYSGGNIWEFGQPNQLVSLNRPAVPTYSITYEENGGSAVDDATDQTNLPDPLPTTTKADKAFGGWYTTSTFDPGTEAVAGAALTDNVTLYAKWVDVSIWALTYSSNVTVGTDKVVINTVEYAAKKTGTSSAFGSTTIEVPTGATTLHFHAAGWGADAVVNLEVKKGETLLNTFALTKDAGVKSNSPFTLEGTPYLQYYSVALSEITEPTTITFEAKNDGGKRFVLYGVNQEGGTVPATIAANPASIGFGSVEQNASVAAKTINVTLTNVAAATVTLAGDDAFSIDQTSLTENGTITVTPNTTTVGTYAATVTISDDAHAADDVVVNVTMTVTEPEVNDDVTGTWTLVTDAATLAVGKKVIIAQYVDGDGEIYTMGKQNTNNRAQVESTVSGATLTPATGTKVLTLVDAGEGKFAIQASNGNYLSAAGTGTSNHLKEAANYDNDNEKWTITIASDQAKIQAASSNRNTIRYNSGSSIFSCYAEDGQAAVALYMLEETTPPTPDYTEVRTGLTIGKYYTICYPKAMTDIKGATLWSFIGKDETTAYIVQESAPFAAGKPYIMCATAEKFEAIFEGEDATAGSNNGLYGTLAYMDATALANAGATHMLYNNEVSPIGTDNHLNENRAYIILNNISGGKPAGMPAHMVRSVPMHKDVITGMDELNASETPVKVLINGQLYILRGEKMYNANGQLVK